MGSLPCPVLAAGVKESTGIVRDSSVRGIGTDPEASSAVCDAHFLDPAGSG